MNRKRNDAVRRLTLADWSLGLGMAGLISLLKWPWPQPSPEAGYVFPDVTNLNELTGRIRDSVDRGGPLGGKALTHGWLTHMMSKGRNLYVSLFAQSLEHPDDPRSAWPQTDGAWHLSGIAHQFTRNITATNTSQLTGAFRDTYSDATPMKLNGGVVVQNGGGAFSFSEDELEMK